MKDEKEMFAALDRLSRDLGDVKHQMAMLYADQNRTTRRKYIAARNILNDAVKWIMRETAELDREIVRPEKETVG